MKLAIASKIGPKINTFNSHDDDDSSAPLLGSFTVRLVPSI
jgi:hypothetical protein